MNSNKWWNSRFTGLGLVLFFLLFWELAVSMGMTLSPSLPPVSQIFMVWANLIFSGEILWHLSASLSRMFLAYFLAAILGIFLGLLMGYFRFFKSLLDPIVEIFRPIPTPAYIPVVILFLGLDTAMKVFIIAIATFFPILLNTYGGVRQVDHVQIDTGRTFGLSSQAILRKIVLPAAIPQIFTGLRIGLGIALIMVVISEMVAANEGAGYFILHAQRTFKIPEMYAGIFTLGLVGYLLNLIFIRIERKIVHW